VVLSARLRAHCPCCFAQASLIGGSPTFLKSWFFLVASYHFGIVWISISMPLSLNTFSNLVCPKPLWNLPQLACKTPNRSGIYHLFCRKINCLVRWYFLILLGFPLPATWNSTRKPCEFPYIFHSTCIIMYSGIPWKVGIFDGQPYYHLVISHSHGKSPCY
jgi:hypothetical protein